MGDNSKMVRVPRAWVFLVMGAAILGAGVASVAMVSWIVPRLAKNEAARVNAPLNAPVNPSANEPAVNREGPRANVPAEPPPAKPPVIPPDTRTTPPKEEPPPPPPPDPTPQHHTDRVWELPAGAAFKYKAAGGAWVDGTEKTELSAGMRIKVSSGRVTIEFCKSRVIALSGCDLTLERKAGGDALTLHDGSLFIDGSCVQGPLGLNLPQQAVVLEGAILAARAASDLSELELMDGSAKFGDQEVSGRDVPVSIAFGAATLKRALSHQRAAEIENSLRPARDVLVAWDFEGSQLPCALGKRLSPGFRGSQGALMSAPDLAALGDTGDAIFKPAENTRVRMRLKTNVPQVRLSFVAGTGRLAETWSFLLLTPSRGWALCEVPLAAFAKPFKEARPWAGQSCHSLQFRMRFDDTDPTLPSERYLVIDDVEIFTPK
ncbi:hypothetical protein PLCT1_00582 [Planctomycetaceae bacterium]|nr:hypothetical protein PLCT1_00582 [Planctomycetaceae bacterium]